MVTARRGSGVTQVWVGTTATIHGKRVASTATIHGRKVGSMAITPGRKKEITATAIMHGRSRAMLFQSVSRWNNPLAGLRLGRLKAGLGWNLGRSDSIVTAHNPSGNLTRRNLGWRARMEGTCNNITTSSSNGSIGKNSTHTRSSSKTCDRI